jgi:hypothetical protein
MSEAPPEMFLSAFLSTVSSRQKEAVDPRMLALALKTLCVWSYDCPRACDALLKQPSTGTKKK